MGKFRVVPIILSNGVGVVKGSQFNNWRIVGTVPSMGRLFAARSVDELTLIDIRAYEEQRVVSIQAVADLADYLRVPFSVGGGIKNLEEIVTLLSEGADKVVIGRSLLLNPSLITEAASHVGSQALVASVNIERVGSRLRVWGNPKVNLRDHLLHLEELGIGEFMIQNPNRDGTMSGLDIEAAEYISSFLSAPFVFCGGAKDSGDAIRVSRAGASGIGVGALFQFTHITPEEIKKDLIQNQIEVRH
jgi:cyclase